jgi:hypothetical protein
MISVMIDKIVIRDHMPQVNKGLATALLKQDTSKLMEHLGKEDETKVKDILSNPLGDDRFGKLFTDPVIISLPTASLPTSFK